jgi:hypothetical protein
MNINRVSWLDILAVTGVFIALLALLRDVFEFTLNWNTSANSLKRFIARRRVRIIIIAIVLLGFVWLTYTRFQRLEALATDTYYRPNFLFNSYGPFQSRNELAPRVTRLDIATNKVSYVFEYNLPTNEANLFSGFLLESDNPENVSDYRYLRVVVAFNDPEAKCEVFLTDFNGVVRNFRLDGHYTDDQIKVVDNGSIRTILIPLSKFENLSAGSIKQVGFQANTNYVAGQHTVIIEDVSFSKE